MDLEKDYLELRAKQRDGAELSEEELELLMRLEKNIDRIDLMNLAIASGDLKLVNEISGGQLSQKLGLESFLKMGDILKASDRVNAKLAEEKMARANLAELETKTLVKVPLTDIDDFEMMEHVDKTVTEEGIEVGDNYDSDKLDKVHAFIAKKFHGQE